MGTGAEEPSELALLRYSGMASAAMGGWVLGSSPSSPPGNSRVPREECQGFPPFTFHYHGTRLHFSPSCSKQLLPQGVLLSQIWLGWLTCRRVGRLLVLTFSAPEVPYFLSLVRSGLGAGYPPAFVSAELRCWRGSEQPLAEITLIVCAAGSAPLFLTW